MKIKPVEVATAPKYPDKYNDEIRRALICAKPQRWRGTPLAAVGMSAVVALSISGCSPKLPKVSEYTTAGGLVQSPAPIVTPDETEEYITWGTPVPSLTLPYDSMIPLFEYGEGTGAIGCVSIAAPVFMSEEEAFAILCAAFAEAGLTLNEASEAIENASLPVTNVYGFAQSENTDATIRQDIIPDGILEYNLPIIFVSKEDVENWHKDTDIMISVSVYDVKKAAQILAENNPHIAVFYDPVAALDYEKLFSLERKDGESDEAYYSRYEAVKQEESSAAQVESERLLRMQAEAFVKWLRAYP